LEKIEQIIKCDSYLCFNQDNKQNIIDGFKRKFTLDHVMTGRELCDILNISYDEIVSIRKADANDNFDFYIEELLKIPEVKEALLNKLKI